MQATFQASKELHQVIPEEGMEAKRMVLKLKELEETNYFVNNKSRHSSSPASAIPIQEGQGSYC